MVMWPGTFEKYFIPWRLHMKFGFKRPSVVFFFLFFFVVVVVVVF